MRRALGEGTARIGSVGGGAIDLETHNTAGAVATGTVLGAAAAVDGIVAHYQMSMSPDTHLLLTGGESALLASKVKSKFELVPDLVLRGLCIAARAMLAPQSP